MSVADFRAELSAFVVPGVARRYAGKPLDIEAGDCPAQWVGAIEETRERITFTLRDPTYSASLNIAVAAIASGDSPSNEAQKKIDQLSADLNTEMDEIGVTGFSITEYSLEQTTLDVNGTVYDGLTMTVTAKDL